MSDQNQPPKDFIASISLADKPNNKLPKIIILKNFFILSLYYSFQIIFTLLKSTYLVKIRKDCFEKIQRLKASFFSTINIGDVISRINVDIDKFLDFIHFNLFFSILVFLLFSSLEVIRDGFWVSF